MIVVFESKKGTRGEKLRYQLSACGYPCAHCDSETIKFVLPVDLIVTFTDQVDILRRLPYDTIPVMAYGTDHVNHILQVEVMATQRELIEGVGRFIRQRETAVGCLEPFKTMTVKFLPPVEGEAAKILINGIILKFTAVEYRMIRCLYDSWGACRNAEQLSRFCCGDGERNGRIRVHVCNINKKAETVIGIPLIASSYGKGYHFLPGEPTVELRFDPYFRRMRIVKRKK